MLAFFCPRNVGAEGKGGQKGWEDSGKHAHTHADDGKPFERFFVGGGWRGGVHGSQSSVLTLTQHNHSLDKYLFSSTNVSGIVCLRAFTACRLGCPRDQVNHLCQACLFHSDCCHQLPLLLLSPSTPHPTNNQVLEKTLSQLLHVPHLSTHPSVGFLLSRTYITIAFKLACLLSPPVLISPLHCSTHPACAVLGVRVGLSSLQMRKQGSESESTCPGNIFRR